MNLLVRVRHWLEERFQFSNALARLIRVFPAGNPLPHPRDVRALADEGYRKNVIIYRCIREIAESAAEPVLQAKRPGAHEPLTRHPLARLLQQPNDEQSTFSFIETLITHQQIAGSWYVHIVRSPAGLPVELWPLRADRVEIVPGRGGRIQQYNFTVDGTRIPLDPADVIHDALLDPLDDYYGLSPIAVAALVADADSMAMDFLRRFFLNAATPAGIVKLKKKVPPEKRREIKEKWEEQLRGPGGWHSVGVLDEDAEYQSVGSPMKDLNLTGVLSETEARLCGVFGVPPIIVAAKLGLDRSTYANYEEARRSFWVETLRPMYRRFADRLTFALRREFGNVEVAFDFSKVGPLQESQEAIRKFAFLSWRDGLLTRNEARASIGLPTVANGDVFRLTTNDLFLKEGDLPPSEPIAARREDEPALLPSGEDGNGGGNGEGGTSGSSRRPGERLKRLLAAWAHQSHAEDIVTMEDPEVRQRLAAVLPQITFQMPEPPPPVIPVVQVNVPEAPAPVVNVTVPAPVVNITTPPAEVKVVPPQLVTVAAPDVTVPVTVEPAPPPAAVRVERDRDGKIKRIVREG